MPTGWQKNWRRYVATKHEFLNGFGLYYNFDPDTGCWLWFRNKVAGYGRVVYNKTNYRAHRLMWELTQGPIPPGMFVCHHCDTPGCVNPKHLFIGTHADNTADMVQKHRQAIGERHGSSKLTHEQVFLIIMKAEQGFSQSQIAKEFGVTKTTIGEILRGEIWSQARAALAAHEEQI